MALATLLARWQTDPDFMDGVAAWRTLPPRPARLTGWPPGLDRRVVTMARRQGSERPYSHQAAAIEVALQGQHVIIVSTTASGKTLGYNAPVLHTLLNDPDAHALYLFPTKALAQDQLASLRRFIGREAEGPAANAGAAVAPLRPATYDGDTPPAARREIRQSSRLILSNPDMLHAGLLPRHPRWQKFFAGLRFVVLDELHTYRGVFGSHVANVLRRLQRVCRYFGASPQFICTSATIANPRELAESLTGASFTLIDGDGSPQPRKHFLFYNPPLLDPDAGVRRSLSLTAQELATDLMAHDIQTVIFARTRLGVEVLLGYLRDTAGRQGLPAERVQAYRSGYLPSARRAIEAGIRRGEIRTTVATTALELGIDIGGLDACLLAGYPGTIASTWQQAGRAGRRAGEALTVLVAGAGALDQYLMHHPDYFFERSPEHARIAPDNLAILLSHLQCAAYELPLSVDEPFGPADQLPGLLDYLAAEGVLRRVGDRWHWFGDGFPAGAVSLRSALSDNVIIEAASESGPLVIGEIDRPSVPLLLYEGAIYLHQGQTYRVTALDWEAGRAAVEPVEVDYYTQAQTSVEVEVLAVAEAQQLDTTARAHGQVLVTARATGFRQIKRYTHETLGYGEIDLPEQEMETSAYWLTLTEAALERLRQANLWRFDRIRTYGPNWPAQRQAALARDGRRCRLCNAPEPPGRQHDVHHLRPLREFLLEAGAGAAVNLARATFPPDVYERANALSNLLTVCRACHRRLETAQRMANAWRGLAYLLGNLAPLFLMCDARDIGSTYETQARSGQLPSITLYDQIPGGLGFSEQLFELHDELLRAAHELVARCPCRAGCPACVGPVLAGEEETKAETTTLLEILAGGRQT